MGYPNKIVTCCYCGTRAALVLKGKTRHELACSTCGAPLHDLKMIPKQARGDLELVRPSSLRKPAQSAKPKKNKWKKRKKWFEDAFDLIEDIFD